MKPGILKLAIVAIGLVDMTANAGEFDLQGHRGARGLSPENTLVSFARALSIGVNTLELDVGISRDGIVVITHNPRLSADTTRDNEGHWLTDPGPALRNLSYKELQAFDVGRINPQSKYAGRFPDQVADDGARIPSLDELILLVKRSGNESVGLNIETKINPTEPDLFLNPEAFVAAIVKVVRDHGFIDRITIQSFDWRTLQEAHRQAPDIPTSYLTAQQRWLNNILKGEDGPSVWTAGYDIDEFEGSIPHLIKAAGGNIWSPYFREIDADQVKLAHDLGLKIKVWTVNEPDQMELLINMGVDGIITDYPDRLLEVMKNLGMQTPIASTINP